VQEFHRQLFASSSDFAAAGDQPDHRMQVREATAEVEPASGAVV